jgi:hypothetical protein
MAWTIPRTWVPGELVTASMMNIHVRDNLNAIKNWLPNQFRGLRLRTHPDADVAVSKVAMLSLDEAIMQDGFRYQPTSFPLVADISASGAGGLDTGAEVASTWYEVYLIGKSSTGAASDLKLMLHRAKDYLKDTAFETATDNWDSLRADAARTKLAQGVTPATGGSCEFVDLQLFKAGAPTGRIWITIEADASGSPSGTPLVTSDKIDVSGVTVSNAWIRFPFRTPVTLTGSTVYHVVLQGDYTLSGTNLVNWRGVLAGGYAGGAFKKFDGASTWSADVVLDANFRLFTVQHNTALTMPSGYDQSCKLGYVYNNGSSNFVAFNAYDRTVRRLVSALFASTAAFPLLQDLSTVLPPAPVAAFFQANNSAITNYVAIAGVPDGFSLGAVAPGESGMSIINSPGAGFLHTHLEVNTELQSVYVTAQAGTANVYAVGYRW